MEGGQAMVIDRFFIELVRLVNSRALDLFFGNFITVYALYLMGLFILILFIDSRTRRFGVLVGIAYLLTYLTGELFLKNLAGRSRPFLIYDLPVIIRLPTSYAFPSGHASMTFAVAGVFYFVGHRYRYQLLAFAAYVAFSRVYLNVHFFSDIAAGAALGILVAYVTTRYIGPFLRRHVFDRHYREAYEQVHAAQERGRAEHERGRAEKAASDRGGRAKPVSQENGESGKTED
jgi:undecaprenyl-diphosphatase